MKLKDLKAKLAEYPEDHDDYEVIVVADQQWCNARNVFITSYADYVKGENQKYIQSEQMAVAISEN